jgi:hypothetical protein
MKKVMIYLLLVCSTVIYAQKYVPFPTNNAQWNVKYKHESDYSPIKTLTVLNYSIKGDTIINSKTYKKVYGGIDNKKIKGGIREENKRIYYLDINNSGGYLSMIKPLTNEIKNCVKQQIRNLNGEFLLYDFNKTKIGDTLFVFPWGNISAIITNIDSVLIQNSYRKRYEYNALWHGKDYVIEGIGSVKQGLFGAITDIPMCGYFDWEFICFSQNGETVYQNPDYVSCNSTGKWSDSDYLKTGTQWYYGEKNYISINNPEIFTYDYNSVKSVGDTVINDRKCYKINRVRGYPMCYSTVVTVYMNQSNDTTYFYNSDKNKFCPLYIYRAYKGDSWTVEFPFGDIVTTVDSVSRIDALNRTLTVQHVTYSYKNDSYMSILHSRIIENVGDVHNLYMSSLYYNPSCDDFSMEYQGLRCYVHPDYGTYHVPGALECSYVTEVPKQNYNSLKVSLNSSGILTVEGEFNTDSYTVDLLDLKGSMLLKKEVNTSRNTISLINFDKGLYLYRISNNGMMLKAGKLVKQ